MLIDRSSPDFALRLEERDQRRKAKSVTYLGSISALAWLIVTISLLILGTIVVRGLPAISWEFLTTDPKEGMTAGGIGPMIRGTLLLMLGTFFIVLPVGILAGVFLAEYAGRGRWVQVAKGLITSLAGTPSVIYGLFGLAFFVIWFKQLGITDGSSLLAGWLTLSLMALPVIVLSTETALRGVPDAHVDGALALGMTKWQTIWRVSLPYALPGILTGIVTSVSRVAGEAPPILFTAGIFFTTEQFTWSTDLIKKPVMNLPYHLTEGFRQPGTFKEQQIWGTCLVLLSLILLLNLTAILFRARSRARHKA